MPIVSYRTKQNKAELRKQKMTVISVAVATMKFLLGMCNRTADTGVAPGSFRRGADSSDEGAKIWFLRHYKCQRSPKKSLFTFRLGASMLRRGDYSPLALPWRHPWVDSDVGTGDSSLVLGIVHVCGNTHVRLYVFPGMDYHSHTLVSKISCIYQNLMLQDML